MTPGLEAARQALREAPFIRHQGDVAERLIEPLVMRRQKHYKGYTNRDYCAILLGGELGAVPSIRGIAETRRDTALEYGEESPSKSATYSRLTCITTDELQRRSSDLAMLTLSEHCARIGKPVVNLILDEFDESSASCSPYRGEEATTEVGRLVKPRKRYISMQKRNGRKNRFHHFLDYDMLGVEYIGISAVAADGTRFMLSVFPTDGPAKQVTYVHALNDIHQRLAGLGIHARVRLLDRRWDDISSCQWLDARPGRWIIRGRLHGRAGFNPLNAPQRRRLRAQIKGREPWSRRQLAERLWEHAEYLPNHTNVLGASIKTRPFQDSDFECTVVVLYTLRRGYHLKPGEQLDPRHNMRVTILLTNEPPGLDTVTWAFETYGDRWDIEVDIKEHKSYVQRGSGPRLFMRVLKEQLAMILEGLATYLHAYYARHGRRKFVRYIYNRVLRDHVVYDALRGGWAPAKYVEDPKPPSA